MRRIYSLLLILLAPLLLVWMAVRAHRAGGQWAVLGPSRFGHYRHPRRLSHPIWVHAVSLGETRAAQPLVRALLDSGHQVLLTHLTASGHAEGQRVYAAEIAHGTLQQAWLPYDFPGAARRFVRHYRPALGVLIERELWPNLLWAAAVEGLPVILASARMSARSMRRALRLGGLMRQTYGRLSQTYAQTLTDARRLERAGASRVSVSGNFKFDVRLDDALVARGRRFAAQVGRPVIVIASTREGEDAPFVQAMANQVRRWQAGGLEPEHQPLFYLIPRHPQRFVAAAELVAAAGLSMVRRTQLLVLGDGTASAADACREVAVLLGDSLGEMPWYYACCQVAIVAGSFAPLGGQNFIEASALGCPVVVGPHTHNFAQAVTDALQAGAIVRADSPEAAICQAVRWLNDPVHMTHAGDAGRHWVSQHAGAVARVLNGIEDLLASRP